MRHGDEVKTEIKIADPTAPEIIELLDELSNELLAKTGRDGRKSFADTDMKVPRSIFLSAFEKDTAIGCGALRPIDDKVGEIKRMHVRSKGKGIGTSILNALEKHALNFGYSTVWLETGIENEKAISFYNARGYKVCENYGQYKGRPECICFEKHLV